MSLRIKNILPILIIFSAILLRFYRFEEFVTFLGDQGRDAIIIKRIVTLEHFPAIGAPSSLGQVFLGPFYYYLIAPFLLFFRFNPLGLAFGVGLLNLVGIVLAYLVIKKEVNRGTALVFLFFAAFSVVNIQFSRFSWNPNLLPVFAFFSVYFFYKLLTSKNRFYAVGLGAFLALSIQLHHLALLLLPPIVIVLVLFFFKNKSLTPYGNLFISVVSFLFFYSPLIIFDLRHEFLNSKSFFRFFTEGERALDEPLTVSILETLRIFYKHVFQVEISLFFALVLTVAIILVSVRKFDFKKNLFLYLNLAVFLVYLILFGFLKTNRIPHYYNSVYLGFFLVLAWALTSLTKNFFFRTLVLVVVISVFFFNNLKASSYLFTTRGNNQIKNAEKIAVSILKNNPKTPFQVVALPYVETDGHIRYFLEINGKKPLPADTLSNPVELYVLCFGRDSAAKDGRCQVLGNAQWQIAAFQKAEIAKIWDVEGIRIYKLIHADN